MQRESENIKQRLSSVGTFARVRKGDRTPNQERREARKEGHGDGTPQPPEYLPHGKERPVPNRESNSEIDIVIELSARHHLPERTSSARVRPESTLRRWIAITWRCHSQCGVAASVNSAVLKSSKSSSDTHQFPMKQPGSQRDGQEMWSSMYLLQCNPVSVNVDCLCAPVNTRDGVSRD